ncbi:hypothetical protein [uncultured Thomasclavelia sp.]|uniref:hypothetical protein n=1 Tax=uncultured Thomasclavelia sp. TaxID=3025759 RepID=UPI002597727E|nr:hypothetical protein [uncultured Thomasclavelia sp.]
MEEIKVIYEQIEKANKEITYMNIKRKDNKTGKTINKKYAEVHQRVNAFRKVYPMGLIKTEIEDITDDSIRILAIITDENGNTIATGRASEKKDGLVNSTSMIENCETSAVGRALGFAGFGLGNGIATAEEINRAESQRDPMENMPIQEGQKQWLKENCTEDELKKAIVNYGKKKLSDLNFAEAEHIRDFKEKELDKKFKEETEIF